MSFRAVAWAFDRIRGLGQGEKLVLLALAEFANDEDETWRSREEIAKRAECSLRSVASHLNTLDECGLISRVPRYSWCGDQSGACADKSAHKHRSGTTYRLHLDVEGDFAESTDANLAHVDFSAECSGCGHTCKSCTCGDDRGSTDANSGSPQMQQVAPICTYNPQINHQTKPNQTHQEELPEKQLFGNPGGGLETSERDCDALVASGDASLATSDRASSKAGLAGVAGEDEAPNPTPSPNDDRQTPRKRSVRHLERSNRGGVVSGQGNAPESRSERRLDGSGVEVEIDSPLRVADAELIAECLPPPLRVLDSGGADWAFLATVLPESWLDWLSGAGVRQLQRLAENACGAGGWTPSGLREVLASNPLPPPSDVRNPTGFLIARVRDVLAVGKPPSASERRAEVQREKRVFLEDVASKRLALDWEVFKRVNAIAQRGYDDDPDLFDQVRQMADDWYEGQEKRA